MSVRWDYFDNEHPSYVERSLKSSLSRYAEYCDFVYVGRTDSPERRLVEHQNALDPSWTIWDEMVVVYKHYSLGFVVQLENALIDFINKESYDNIRWNTKGTQWHGPQTFYIYLLLDADQRRKNPQSKPDYGSMRSGHVHEIRPALQKLLDQYAAQRSLLYVGVSNDPERRYREHQSWWAPNDRWDRMVVLYQTSSLNYALQAESQLIHYMQQQGYDYENRHIPPLSLPPFWLYFLLERKKA